MSYNLHAPELRATDHAGASQDSHLRDWNVVDYTVHWGYSGWLWQSSGALSQKHFVHHNFVQQWANTTVKRTIAKQFQDARGGPSSSKHAIWCKVLTWDIQCHSNSTIYSNKIHVTQGKTRITRVYSLNNYPVLCF